MLRCIYPWTPSLVTDKMHESVDRHRFTYVRPLRLYARTERPLLLLLHMHTTRTKSAKVCRSLSRNPDSKGAGLAAERGRMGWGEVVKGTAFCITDALFTAAVYVNWLNDTIKRNSTTGGFASSTFHWRTVRVPGNCSRWQGGCS